MDTDSVALALQQKPITVLSGSSQGVQNVAFGPGGGTLIASGNDGIVRLWNVADRTIAASITASSREIFSMSDSSFLGIIATTDGQHPRVADRSGSSRGEHLPDTPRPGLQKRVERIPARDPVHADLPRLGGIAGSRAPMAKMPIRPPDAVGRVTLATVLPGCIAALNEYT